MTHTEIVEKVKSILNEHGEVDAVSIGENRVLIEDYINLAIPDAVIMLAQKGYRVNVVERSNIFPEDLGFEDFVSLIMISSPSWKKTVIRLTDINSPEYEMAQNPYTKPGIYNPIAYSFNGGGDVMVMPDVVDGANVEMRVLYNAQYDGETLNAEPKEATAVCYMAAALVLGMFEDDQGKQRLSDVATNMLQ